MPGAVVRARSTGFSSTTGGAAGAALFAGVSGADFSVAGFSATGFSTSADSAGFAAAGMSLVGFPVAAGVCAGRFSFFAGRSATFGAGDLLCRDSLRTGFAVRPSSALTAARSSSPTALNIFFTL